jgi:two-component system invasion response regulator UvrY
MNILIIEDHPLIRLGLRQLIAESDPKATISQADNFPTGLSLLDSEKFELLILDIDVPGGENIRMMEIVRKRQPEILILIHSGYDEDVYALPYMQAGADGFLSKSSSHEEFQSAYKALINRGKYVSYHIQQTLLNNLGDATSKKLQNPIIL